MIATDPPSSEAAPGDAASDPCAPPAWSEADRLAALARYGILDTGREAAFDEVAEIAADLLDAPLAVVNLIASDRQWFKAEVGIGTDGLPLDVSICRHAILQPGVMVVPDLRDDPRFEGNPLVTASGGLRFYAGALLETPDGLPLGTVCVLDREARPQGIAPRQERALRALAAQVMALIELRLAEATARQARERAERQGRRLALLAQASARLLAASDPGDMIRDVHAFLADAFRLDVFFHYACQEGGLGLVASAGLTPEQEAAAARLEYGQTICGIVAQTREPVHLTEVQRWDDPHAAFIRMLGIDTYKSVPLVARGELIGTLSFGRRAPAFSKGELEVLRTLAAHVATALDRLRSDASRAESEARLALFVEHAPAAIAMFDRDMRIVAHSRRLGEEHRLPEGASLVGLPLGEAFPEAPERWREAHARVLDGETVSADDDPVARADGSRDWARWEMRPWRDARGQVGGTILFSEVTTARVEAERETRRWRDIVEVAGFGIAVADAETQEIVAANAAFARMHGHESADALVGRPLGDTFAPGARADLPALAARVMAKRHLTYEAEHVRADGSTFPCLTDVTAIADESGRVTHRAATFIDISERKLAEARQAFLLGLEDRMRGRADPAGVVAVAAEALGRELGAARVCYSEVEQGGEWIRVEQGWTDGRLEPATGRWRVDGLALPLFEAFAEGRTTIVRDFLTDPLVAGFADAAEVARSGTRASLDVPILRDGALHGLLSVNEPVPRDWTEGEVALVEEVARRTWSAFERARARSELALRTNEMEALLTSAPVGICFFDREHRWLQINEELAAANGLSVAEHVGQRIEDLFPGNDHRIGRIVDRVFATGEAVRAVEMTGRAAAPERRVHWLASYFPVRGDGGAVTAVGCWVIDITERKEAEARLRAVVDAVPVGLVFADAAGRIEGGNALVEEILGHAVLPSVDVDAYRDWEGYHPDGRRVEGREYPLAKVLSGEAQRPELEVIYRRGDGRDAWIRFVAAPMRDAGGAILGGVVASLDIDRERRAEAALRRLNAELSAEAIAARRDFERLFQTSGDAVVVVDAAAGRLVRANPAFARMLGRGEAELTSMPFAELFHPDDRERAALETARLVAGTPTIRFESRLLAAQGAQRTIAWSAVPEGGVIYGFGRDVTDERAAAEQLAQLQKMETIGHLTGGVAHDFNNLLTPIVATLDILRRRTEGDERLQRLIGGALQSADRGKTLVQRLLAFARRQTLQPRAVDPAALVEGMREFIDRSLGPAIAVRVDVPRDLPAALVDPNQLELALLNLAVNARDAMPGGGTLTIAARTEAAGAAASGDLEPGTYLRLSVADDGAGMDRETLARAVEPFFSTKAVGQGTGLGLSMVHGLAAQSGGAFRLESRLGRGTTATLWLPVAEAAAQAPATAEAEATPTSRQTCLLLVDDEPLVRETTADGLRDLGYEVVEAASAAAALERVRAGLEPDLLLTDHMMPGMTGTGLAAALREALPGLPVLMITGYANLAPEEAHDIAVIAKPFRFAELAAALEALLAGDARAARLAPDRRSEAAG